MKNLTLALLASLMAISTIGQVTKQVVLEHFTNTRCSVCASSSKNPALNANLQNHPDVIRISYHPSSPYSSCIFNQHNVSGNDDRTNQYGIYGATPRLVIQGEVITPNQNFSAPTLFDDYYGEFTPILLNTRIDSITSDSTYVTVVATTVSALSVSSASLYVGLAEDTIAYVAPNGESSHYNVFRTALNGNQGTAMNLATSIGDSVVMNYVSANSLDWNLGNLVAFSILQDNSDLSVIQGSISNTQNINNSSVEELEGNEGFDIHLNSGTGTLTILKEDCNQYEGYEIVGINGQVIAQGRLTGNLTYVGLTQIPQGVYLVRLADQSALTRSKALKFVR